jgi:hypothetical protein
VVGRRRVLCFRISPTPRHPQGEDDDPLTYAEQAVGHSTRHAKDTTRQSTGDDDVSDPQSSMSDEGPDTENRLFKPQTGDKNAVSGLSGSFEEEHTSLCIHGCPGGKGCYLCDREHPYRLKEAAAQGGTA